VLLASISLRDRVAASERSRRFAARYAGTYFWVDPKEELVAVYMSQAPSTVRAYYRRLVKQLIYAAIIN
jgi:CubicO group peptidase (beta-lactamase class C family)